MKYKLFEINKKATCIIQGGDGKTPETFYPTIISIDDPELEIRARVTFYN